jgi:hypothetical protein
MMDKKYLDQVLFKCVYEVTLCNVTGKLCAETKNYLPKPIIENIKP